MDDRHLLRQGRRRELADAYDSVAEAWYAAHHEDDWWVSGAERFVGMLPPGPRVLDAGCGAGVKAKWLMDRGAVVVGVDLSAKLVAIARRVEPEAEFRVADMQELPADLVGFDGIFAQASILHVPHVEVMDLLAHWRTRMTRGGVLHIAVKERKPGGPREGRKIETLEGVEFTRFFSYWTLEELRFKLMLGGFLTIWESREPSGRAVWLQVVAKAY